MSEVEGGPTPEEIEEAQKFNQMVDEGKLTPAKMAEVEKDKTPKEVETEKNLERGKEIAMSKVGDPHRAPLILHGTYLANLMSVIEHGLDPSRAKTTYYPDDEPFLYAEIKHEYGVKPWVERQFPVYLTFDMDSLKESTDLYDVMVNRLEGHDISNELFNVRNKPEVFNGVVVVSTWDWRTEVLRKGEYQASELDLREQRFPELGLRFVRHKMVQLAKKQPERALPIYDIKGNLLWPQKMTHEQVKQFVAEREKAKKDKNA